MAETALVTRTVEEEKALLEKQRLKKERKELRKAERLAELTELVSKVKVDAARIVNLRRFMFKTEEELDAVVPKLTPQQRKIIRQFEEPKKATAFGVESAAKLIEAETRAQADSKKPTLNIQNAVIQLPVKQNETAKPVVIEVIPESK